LRYLSFCEGDAKDINLSVSAPLTFTSTKTPNAIDLIFTNRSSSEIVIPLCSRWGKGNQNMTEGAGQDHEGVFSQIRYRWLDKGKKQLAEGTYNVSAPALKLKPKGTQTLLIPLTQHSLPEAQQIEVQFDNRLVEKAVKSYNLFQYVPPGSERYFLKGATYKWPHPSD